ncbi:CCT domain-containing protein [Chloropicon primus]|nr:CCT domain-containing protein [Chloropicon primus]
MIDDQVLLSNPGTGFPDFLLDDGYMNAMLCAEEAELMRALGDPVFDNVGGEGSGSGSGSDDTLDNKLNEKQVVIAAQAAAGLNRSGLKRAAFSMNDLTALQPSSGKANGLAKVKKEPKPRGRRGSKKGNKLKSLDENEPMAQEELSSLGTLDQPDLMPSMHYQQFQDSQQVLMNPQTMAPPAGQWSQNHQQHPHQGQGHPHQSPHPHQMQGHPHQGPPHSGAPPAQQVMGAPPPQGPAGSMPMQQHHQGMYNQPSGGGAAAGHPHQFHPPASSHHVGMPPHHAHPGMGMNGVGMNGGHHGHMNGMNGSMMNGGASAPQGGTLRRVASSPNFGKHLENATKKEGGLSPPGGNHAAQTGNGDGRVMIGTLTLDERRARILRYRQKRHERNFRKRIKYNCRKTLADSRPKIRGRFARNDEIEELLKQKKLEEQKKSDSSGSGSSSKTDDKQASDSSDKEKEVKSNNKAKA